MPEEINNLDGRLAIETDEPMSIQEANIWALTQRDKADTRKAAIERLRCEAAKRRERKPANPLETLKPNPTYRVREFNPEAGAFNVDSSDGKKLLGQSLSNGNVRSGQKVRSFFAPGGQVVIDVKPKGRDINLPKPQAKPPVEDLEIWPCTVCFLYSRIKPNTENLTDNGAAVGDETSWDGVRAYSSPLFNSYSYAFRQRFDTLGDYATAQDALDNKLKPDRLITPSGTGSGAAKDNAAAGSGSADAITIWFYIGNPADALTDGRIVQVTGPPFHPSAGNIQDSGPGFCMEINRGGVASAIFPSEQIGAGPLTRHLRNSFPELGGQIGYAGRVEKWRGMQDYIYASFLTYFRSEPSATESNQIPTTYPDWYEPDFIVNPWLYTGSQWFQFGWPDPQYSGCASSSWINIELAALNATTACGASIDNNQWYWGGDAAPYRGVIDRSNPSGFIGTTGMFVCWRGHKDHVGMVQSYFEGFKDYWGITGSVTKLGSANPYGCEIPGSGGGYPPAPPADASRFIAEASGRKAEIWLKICKEDLEPIEIKLPFEFAAVIESITVLGGGSFGTGSSFESSKTLYKLATYGSLSGVFDSQYDGFNLENPHATLSIDDKFAYVDILYGADRIWEEPLQLPVKPRLANMGFGSPRTGGGSNYGLDFTLARRPSYSPNGVVIRISGDTNYTDPDTHPRLVKDCFSCCQSYKVQLPTKENPTPVIVAFQKYKRGENITLTAANPDNEFNNKFLIADFRTEFVNANDTTKPFYVTSPRPYYATFAGLPALIQLADYSPENIALLTPVFYKNQEDWTPLDWLYFQLQEAPKQYNPITTILPPGVVAQQNTVYGTYYELDGKFERHGRAEVIMPATAFGYNNTYFGSSSPTYNPYGVTAFFPLFIEFKEQLIGNGLLKDGKLSKWFRISTSSFPLFGQLKRNPL